MIKVTANINGEKREVTNYSYQCNLRFCDFPNFAQLIMIYKSVKCKEPPVEGDLITLTFNSTGKESFFYEWIISGDVYDGEIEFVCNEVDVVDIFRFWDCYCVGIEESMSIGGTPMSCTVYLSPGIIKRNNLPVREKVWKVSSPSTDKKVVDNDDTQESKKEISEKKGIESTKKTPQFPTFASKIEQNLLLKSTNLSNEEKQTKTVLEQFKKAVIAFDPDVAIKEEIDYSKQKGNFGEITSSLIWLSGFLPDPKEPYLLKRLDALEPDTIEDTLEQGIDAIYENLNPDPLYIIDEVKFHKGNLRWVNNLESTTKEERPKIKQMSDDWIKQNRRLENAVGSKQAKKIKEAILLGKVEKYVTKVDLDTKNEIYTLTLYSVNSNGEKKKKNNLTLK